MSVTAGGTCATHPEAAATFSCPRCGSFMCAACERRTRPEAMPLCPKCWDLRSRVTVPQNEVKETRMQTTGFVLGLVSIIPIWPVMLASVIINIMSLVQAKEEVTKQKRWKSIVGLSVTVLSGLMWMCLLFFAVLKDT